MVGLVEWEGLEQVQRTNRNRNITPWDRTIVQATTALMTENMKVLMAEEAAIVLQTVGTIPTTVALVTEAAQEVSLLLLAIVANRTPNSRDDYDRRRRNRSRSRSSERHHRASREQDIHHSPLRANTSNNRADDNVSSNATSSPKPTRNE